MKKALSVVLSICMLFTFITCGFAGHKDSAVLRFDQNGNLKILVLADVQDDYPLENDVIRFIEEALDFSNPDVVVFCGDNIVDDDERAFKEMLTPLVERGIPFTFVFGNHDEEAGFDKQTQLEIYQSYPGCLAYDADPELHGCATHNLPVLSSDGSKIAFNLWMFDSGDYVYDSYGEWLGYDWVREDQIEWYNTTREELKAENGGVLVPSMVFQHIIPQEPCEKIFYPSDIGLGELTFNFSDGTHLTVVPDITKFEEGYVFEKSCPSYGNDGQWDALVQGGDVLGMVVGHDHVNSFTVNCDGIDLIMAPGVTFNSYSSALVQGAKVIEINENNPWEYTSYNMTCNELAMKDGSGLGDETGRNQFDYTLNYYLEKVFAIFYDILRDLFGELVNGTL